MKRILSTLTLLLCFAFTAVNAQDNYNATTMGEKVYLETANWGQNSPFNKQIFTSYGGSTNAKAGCVPTAYAIVMRYHGFPTEGTAKTLYNCQAPTYVEITDRVYDFSKMPLTNGSNWTEEQQAETSKFFSHVLHACFPSKIGTGATEVNEGQTSKVLNDYFNYQLINASYQANFTMEQWIEKIKESIDNGCPIPYASDNSGTGDTRHMFVLDGYTANNYFHFNFGWNGSGNGWFKLDAITPSQGDNYSWIDGAEHYALFNLAPNKTMRTVTASVLPAGAGNVAVNGSANSADVMEGTTATLVATANNGYTFSHWSKVGTEVGTEMTYKAKVAAEGNEYVANFYTIGSSVNIPVNYDSNMGSVTYNGNIVSATGFNPNEYSEVTLTAEANDGYMFTGWEIVEGTESTESNDNTVTFIAKNGITVNANFALAGGEYKINNDNITPSGTGKCSTWTYSKEGDIEGILTLSTVNGSTVVNALGTSNRLYAHAYDNSSNSFREITYTLTAKEGFVITGYSLTYVVSKAGQVTVRNATQTQTPSDTQQYTLTYQYANAARSTAYGTRSTEFVLSSTTDSNTQYITIKDFSVAVLSEGGTTDPETPTTPTTYTISVSATEGGSAYIGTGTSTTVTAGNSVTLTAIANNGYAFDGWYNGTKVSSELQYTFTPTASGTYQAKFTANATPEEPSTGTGDLAGKYFRLKTTVNGATKYMNVGTQSDNSHGNVNMVNLNESSDDQIFLFEQSGDGYKLKAKSGNYINCAEWNVNANTTNANEASVLLFEESGDGYLINWYNTFKSAIKYFNVQTANAGDYALHPYSDGDKNGAAVWVLEEVVYYTVTARAGEGGSVSPLTSTVEQGKSVTLTATANEGFRFVNWTLNGNVVSTDASYTFNATAAGEYVANFEISTYTISATANPGTAGSVTINGEAVSSKNVNENSAVTLVATPQAGYHFVNWTLNGNMVSTDANYTIDSVTADGEYVANFEEIVVNATLTDAQGNTYNVQLSGFTTGITTATVATKLTAKYPYITLGDNAALNGSNAAYTYTNMVELPFKVSSVSDAAKTYWYNIYYPSNGDARNPNYIADLNDEDAVVDMAASPEHAYGENPTYNTKAGNPMISWAIYSANNSLEFIFKNELTNNYIKVESVVNATGNTQNVKFVENAEDATAFSLLKDATDSYNGDYALVANIDETTGYLCAAFSDEDYVTHFDSNTHQGAWVKFVEVDYEQYIKVLDTKLEKFNVGDDKHLITDKIQPMINALVEDYGVNITKSQFETYFEAIDAMDAENWPKLSLTIAPDNSGTTTIAGEEGVTRKYVPTGDLTINATPAEGYHFVSWTDGTSEITTAEYIKTISGGKGNVIELTANFAKNSYTVSVTAGEGGSASASTTTVEHGGEVTLTAVPNDGYEFVNWTKGTDVVSTDANYTVTNVTAKAEYVANFQLANTPATHCNVTVNANISGTGIAFIHTGTSTDVTSGRYEVGSTITLTAVSDKDENGYLFTGWYVEDELISTDKTYTVTLSSDVIYTAMFEEGWRVRYSCNYRMGYIKVLDADSNDIGGTNYVLVKKGSTIQMLGVPELGYEFKNWTTNATSDFVSSKNPYSFAVEENMNLTANFEPEHYVLTVRANNDSYGTVTAESGTFGPASSVKVGIAMTATITAVENDGYKFVNWTKDSKIVSTNAIYTVPSVDYSKDLIDTEYVANFEPIENATPGTYYRIAYDFEVPVAAKSAATRAVGEVVEYSITPATGTATLDGDKRTSLWSFTTNERFPAGLTLKATYTIINDNVSETKTIKAIQVGNSFVDLRTGGLSDDGVGNYNNVTFTLSVQNSNYQIVGYDIKSYITSSYIKFIPTGESLVKDKVYGERFEPTTEHSFSFESDKIRLVQLDYFYVYIQEIGGGETPEPEPETVRYYMQSVACGVSGGNNLQNALKMTQETGAASIFYYAGNKLLSYDKGTYIKEDGGTRGLQAVGTSGTVTITTSGETATIAAPNYMHANSNGTTYYVDHCGSNPDNHAANHNFVLEEVTSLPVTITDAGYATWYAPVAVQLPDGLTAYTITIQGDYAITGDGFKQVPANTGVILEGTKGKTYELEIIGSAPEVESIMKGTVAATYFPENDYAYVLSTDKGTRELGFYMADDGEASWSHKAYLPASEVPAGAALSAGFRLILPGTTAIEEVETENNIDAIYDLTGRKLEGISGTGIYIINGKKVLVK